MVGMGAILCSALKRLTRKKTLQRGFLVPEAGLEPAQEYSHMNLNHTRLPIPPPRRTPRLLYMIGQILSRSRFLLVVL